LTESIGLLNKSTWQQKKTVLHTLANEAGETDYVKDVDKPKVDEIGIKFGNVWIPAKSSKCQVAMDAWRITEVERIVTKKDTVDLLVKLSEIMVAAKIPNAKAIVTTKVPDEEVKAPVPEAVVDAKVS